MALHYKFDLKIQALYGVPAMTGPMDTVALVSCATDLPLLADANTTSALVITAPGRYTLDHDPVSLDSIGVLINSSDVVLDGMGHSITGTDANGSTETVQRTDYIRAT